MKPAENDYVKFWLEDDVLRVIYKVKVLDSDTAPKCINTRIDNLDDFSYPAFIDATSVVKVTKEAREYLSSKHSTKQITAAALFINSPLARMMGNFLIIVNKPNIPTKLFTNQEDAINWLKSYPKIKVK